MTIHGDSYRFLSNRKNGASIQEACTAYRISEGALAYELNGRLKTGLSLEGAHSSTFTALRRAICATNSKEMTLYRKTSDTEYVGSLIHAFKNQPFTYMAFLSTSATFEGIHKFAVGGNPIVLEITCPPGTYMAPLDGELSAGEDEYLLGAGTTFSLTRISMTTLGLAQVPNLLLSVESCPDYATTSKEPVFRF